MLSSLRKMVDCLSIKEKQRVFLESTDMHQWHI